MSDDQELEQLGREDRKAKFYDKLKEGELAELPDDDVQDDDGDVVAVDPGAGPPEWAQIPEGFVMPDGWVVYFIRFRAAWTNTPRKGDRQCILWNLSESDEKHAAKRARGDANRIIDEMAKQMVRAIDGRKTDWGGGFGPASITTFWNEIGGKCRWTLKSHYLKTHTMQPAEMADFFEHCVTSRSAG